METFIVNQKRVPVRTGIRYNRVKAVVVSRLSFVCTDSCRGRLSCSILPGFDRYEIRRRLLRNYAKARTMILTSEGITYYSFYERAAKKYSEAASAYSALKKGQL